MSDNKKPRICEVLGVDPFQQFRVSGYGEKYFIDYDGEFCTADCACDDGKLVFALTEAINNPESIKRKPRWTADDIKTVKAIQWLWPDAKNVSRGGIGEIVVRIEKNNHPGYGLSLYVHRNIFEALKNGETVTLDEILEAENDV